MLFVLRFLALWARVYFALCARVGFFFKSHLKILDYGRRKRKKKRDFKGLKTPYAYAWMHWVKKMYSRAFFQEGVCLATGR